MVSSRPWALSSAPPAVLASREPIVRFFSYHDAHPIALVMVLMKEFGHDWFDWESEALKHEILLSFNATSVSEQNWQKIQAARTLMLATGFWAEWEVFEKIVQAFNNNVPIFDVLQRCTLGQLMVGVDIAAQLREEEFDDEVKRYIACCAVEQGVTYLPPPLDFAQLTLSQPQYECLDCGKIDDVDFGFDRCDFCTGRYLHDRPLTGKAASFVPETAGRNVRKFFLRDPSGVKERFDELVDKSSAELDENSAEDVQAAKLVVAHKYMQQRRAQLVEQLKELESWVIK
jgi:hypothetical protein